MAGPTHLARCGRVTSRHGASARRSVQTGSLEGGALNSVRSNKNLMPWWFTPMESGVGGDDMGASGTHNARCIQMW